ncbi:putative oligopeptide transporter, OPT superfamily [Helianthus annuus]|nr:putative oligopeptide transporter, OPT superfamily [Helianthus annuus]
MKLNLTTGMTPNMNVSAALLAFVFMRTWTKILQKSGISSVPFTRHENTMIQTCSVACYSIAIGARGSSLPGTYKEPGVGWMMGYSFLVCFIGLFILIPLRKVLIVDYKLIFPSGMATEKQVKGFSKYFSASFLWGFFQWFFTGKEGDCGFAQFPTFGLKAWKNTYDRSLAFISIALILGDGLYNFIKILCIRSMNVRGRFNTNNLNPGWKIGTQMSRGLKQRISTARTLIRRSKIFNLNEATSFLDSHSEKAVQKAWTRQILAHRIATIHMK